MIIGGAGILSVNFKFMKFLKKIFAALTETLSLRYSNSKRYYAQDGEDATLFSFYETKGDYKGFYVDIGAMHPYRFSNTQMFYDRGWRGINIDATPGVMKLFRRKRPRDINIEAGISDTYGTADYYNFEEGAFNSFNKIISETRIENGIRLKEIIKIDTFPINDILEKNLPLGQKIDFITIDVEGLEELILKTLDFSKYAPDYLLVEELSFVTRDFSEYRTPISDIATAKGYIPLAKTQRTVIFRKKDDN